MKAPLNAETVRPDGTDFRRALAGITAVSILIRLVFVVVFSRTGANALLDSERYTRVAMNLLAGNGFAEWGTHPTAFAPPVYPFFLAACYGLFGVHPLLVKLVQAVAGGLVPLTVFGMGRRLAGDRPALWASAVTAVYPELVVMTGYLYTETFFILMTCLFFMFLLNALQSDRTRDWILSGVSLGLGLLVRGLLLLFPPFLFLAFLAVRPLRPRLKKIVLLSAVGYALLTPWTLRNAAAFHRFIPLTTGGGGELWIGSDVERGGRYRYGDSDKAIRALTAEAKSEPEKEDILFRAALRNMRRDPAGYVRVCLGKGVRFFLQIYENRPTGATRTRSRLVVLVLSVSYFPLLFLGLAGLWRARREWPRWIPLVALFAYTLLLYMATHFVPRYRIPLIPFLSLFAAYGLAGLVNSFPHALKRRG